MSGTPTAADVEMKNFMLVYQDTYVFGKGNLHMTDVVVPEKFLLIN